MPILTPSEAASAVDYNNRKSRSIGWIDQFTELCEAVGFDKWYETGAYFAEHIANWQKTKGISPKDGKIGPTTWKAIQKDIRMCMVRRELPGWLKSRPSASPVTTGAGGGGRIRADSDILPGGSEAPWLDVALAQLNAHWRRDGARIKEGSTGVDEDYFAATPYFGGSNRVVGTRNKDNGHWCAAFVNYCLHTAGYSHCGSAGASGFTWRAWWEFKVLKEPKRGCVIVVKGNGNRHVGFLDRWNNLPDNPRGDVPNSGNRGLYLLGGNQSDTVCSKKDNRLMVAVKRNGVESPYLWPLRGSGNCNCDLPTAHPHFCHAQWQPGA